tara:strand:- start:23303 stop:23761 length:459 start_codon:yes stop_codon:yes gene_type:complete
MLPAGAVTTRNGEYTGTPFTDIEGSNTFADPVLGCNKAGSNACGIGINTGNVDPSLENWSVLGGPLLSYAAREQQYSQPIGGTGLGAGSQGNGSLTSIKAIRDTDINDNVGFVVATIAAVNGAVADAGSAIINTTGATISIGDRLWGPIAVA